MHVYTELMLLQNTPPKRLAMNTLNATFAYRA